ncbi:MAG: arginine--tRNA ligase [Cyanobacteria bacterium P01_H01_bin.121]
MTSVIDYLRDHFKAALTTTFGDDLAETDPLLVPATNPKFGDYQSNVAMGLAKRLQQPPRTIAEQLIQNLKLDETCEQPELAGPGFINLRLKPDFLFEQLQAMQTDERLSMPVVKQPQRVIVDFSSPNIAKEMHVGHLRSTIIGDSIARTLEFLGHDVLRLNHVGDWGTQFGMLITYLREAYPDALTTADALDLGDLVNFYKQAKQRFDEDMAFREAARQEVVRLQSGEPDSLSAWQLLCDQSRREFQTIYDRLDVEIAERGESFYNPLLADVVQDLAATGLLVEDGRAQCVFLEGFTNKDGQPLPLIVQKSDGGYNYATTDLAAIRFRINQDEAQRIIYVTDAGQANHFTQVIQVARRSGWIPEQIELVHVPFGLVQGEDGKKLKTRSGETIRLRDLLDEAVKRAEADIRQRLAAENREESEDFIQEVARVVGISAVKYADLSQNRTSNYIFSYDKMLALQGNTAPYLLYAYVRVQGISRKGQINFEALREQSDGSGVVDHVSEAQEPNSTANPKTLQAIAAPSVLTKVVSSDSQQSDSQQTVIQPKSFQAAKDEIDWPRFLTAGAIAFTTFVALKVIVAVLGTLASLPLVPQVFQLIGLVISTRFAVNHVLFARDRQQLGQRLAARWDALRLSQQCQPVVHQENQIDANAQISATTVPSSYTLNLAEADAAQPEAVAMSESAVTHTYLSKPEELALAKHLLQLEETLVVVERELLPNRLCQYLFELSQKFNQFYDRCPILQAQGTQRETRLMLSDLTARTLKLGLSLLGIPVLERM